MLYDRTVYLVLVFLGVVYELVKSVVSWWLFMEVGSAGPACAEAGLLAFSSAKSSCMDNLLLCLPKVQAYGGSEAL